MSMATLTSKWQVTIPADVRKKLGLKPRERLSFQVSDEGMVVRPVRDLMDFYGAGRDVVEAPVDFDHLREKATEGLAEEAAKEIT